MRAPTILLSLALAGGALAACGDDDGAPPPSAAAGAGVGAAGEGSSGGPGVPAAGSAGSGPGPALTGLGCAWSGATGGVPLRQVAANVDFVAFGSDFEGFRAWPSFKRQAAPDVGGGAHVAGDRTVYINQLPPAGSTAFPKGTIIIKDMGGAEPKLFAMVKRNESYNPTGAVGWEWFEVKELSGDAVVDVEWHGVGPPDGEAYAGNAEGGCNGCHAASTHDAVISVAACANLRGRHGRPSGARVVGGLYGAARRRRRPSPSAGRRGGDAGVSPPRFGLGGRADGRLVIGRGADPGTDDAPVSTQSSPRRTAAPRRGSPNRGAWTRAEGRSSGDDAFAPGPLWLS
jgi:hypothetical protein